MQTYETGTLAGAGSFLCASCGCAITLSAMDEIPECACCEGTKYERASIFIDPAAQPPSSQALEDPNRSEVEQIQDLDPGHYLAFEFRERFNLLPLTHQHTRIGRSATADVRLDNPTVSRRHAIIVQHDDWVGILDDRSLNGVFLNGEKVERSRLSNGDEITIGCIVLRFIDATNESTIERAESEHLTSA